MTAEEAVQQIKWLTHIPAGGPPQRQVMACLPLGFLNGLLFGINASRVKEEIRENLIRYQRDCYKILTRAFLERAEVAISPTMSALAQIRDNALAVAALAEQQMEHERRISASETRLDKAASVVGELGRRVKILEQRTAPGKPIGEEQAAEITQRIKALAGLLTEQDPSKNHPRPSPSRDLPDCPYRGLEAFREEDASRFFGRETVVERLLATVNRSPLVALIGPSGSGKSSVVARWNVDANRILLFWPNNLAPTIEVKRCKGGPDNGPVRTFEVLRSGGVCLISGNFKNLYEGERDFR